MKASAARSQCAALPYRRSSGEVQFLLITSRDTQRWIVPKGWPMKGKSAAQAAAREALQEAGVSGKISSRSIGRFDYDKRISDQEAHPCAVTVFSLLVTKEKLHWREQDQRVRRWFARDEAADHVSEPDLKHLIETFEPR